MTIICNVTGDERKRLAKLLGEFLGEKPVYKYAPTFAFEVGDYTIDKKGSIICPDAISAETEDEIVEALTDEGFSPILSEDEVPAEAPDKTPAEMPDVAPEAEVGAESEDEATEANVGAETPDTGEESTEADQPEDDAADTTETEADSEYDGDQVNDESAKENADTAEDDTKLTVSIPRAKLADDALERLRIMVANKEDLFKRALLADELSIEVTEEEISFPWFTLTGIDGEALAYTQFITALCQMATEQKRVLDKPYDGDNDRFAMRIFMVRLGMKGEQFALARKLMMKHLTGNSGWRFEGSSPRDQSGVPNRATVQHLKRAYPSDSHIKIIQMGDGENTEIQIGAHGKIVGVDDNGSVFIRLDNGTAFGIAFSTGQTEAAIHEEEDEDETEVIAEANAEAEIADVVEAQPDEIAAEHDTEGEVTDADTNGEEDADAEDAV